MCKKKKMEKKISSMYKMVTDTHYLPSWPYVGQALWLALDMYHVSHSQQFHFIDEETEVGGILSNLKLALKPPSDIKIMLQLCSIACLIEE